MAQKHHVFVEQHYEKVVFCISENEKEKISQKNNNRRKNT